MGQLGWWIGTTWVSHLWTAKLHPVVLMNSLKFLLLPLWKITNIFLLLETSNFKQEFESLQYTMLRWEEWQNLSALAPRDELASLLAPPSKWHFPVTICLWTFSARLNAETQQEFNILKSFLKRIWGKLFGSDSKLKIARFLTILCQNFVLSKNSDEFNFRRNSTWFQHYVIIFEEDLIQTFWISFIGHKKHQIKWQIWQVCPDFVTYDSRTGQNLGNTFL